MREPEIWYLCQKMNSRGCRALCPEHAVHVHSATAVLYEGD